MDVERLYCVDLTCLIGECNTSCQNKDTSKCNFCTPKKYYVNDSILDKAKLGDIESQHHIILSLIPVVFKYSMKMQDAITPTIEFISIGNASLVLHMQDALKHTNPCGYLLKYAKMEMMQYKYGGRYLIKIPVGHDAYSVESIPEEFDIEQETFSYDLPSDHSVLYEALDGLPAGRSREIMIRLFGLADQPSESLSDIAGSDWSTKQYTSVKRYKAESLKKILKFLEKHHPEYVQQHTKT